MNEKLIFFELILLDIQHLLFQQVLRHLKCFFWYGFYVPQILILRWIFTRHKKYYMEMCLA